MKGVWKVVVSSPGPRVPLKGLGDEAMKVAMRINLCIIQPLKELSGCNEMKLCLGMMFSITQYKFVKLRIL